MNTHMIETQSVYQTLTILEHIRSQSEGLVIPRVLSEWSGTPALS